jgi:hypothetical protein
MEKLKGYKFLTRFVSFDEPRCLICCTYAKNTNLNHTNDQCPQLWKSCGSFKCFGHHLRSNCSNDIPLSQNNSYMCLFTHLPFVEKYFIVWKKNKNHCKWQFWKECYQMFIWVVWYRNCSTLEKVIPKLLMNVINNDNIARWMANKAQGQSINNFIRTTNVCVCFIEHSN